MNSPARLKERREAMGLTQDILAALLGVTPHAVAKWETPEGRISHRKMPADKIAELVVIEAEQELP